MGSALLLAAALAGQVTMRQCQTASSYRQAYATPAYYYQKPYAANYYAKSYAAPYLEVKFAPVIYDTYAGLVGGEARARNRREEELLSRADLTGKVAALSLSVDKLAAVVGGGVAIQPPPVAPGKPTPDVPGKPTPEVPEKPLPGAPPLPKTNPAVPDDGSVPPPPPVPSEPPSVPPPPSPSAGVPAPDANVLAILTKQCAKCHTAPAKAGKGMVLFSEPGKINPNLGPLDLLMIDQEVYSGAMPKNGDTMNAEDYSRLRAWINQSQDAIEAAIRVGKTPKGAN